MLKHLLFAVCACAIIPVHAAENVYCEVMSAMAYSLNMPGITHVSLNTINRTSEALECGQVECNSFVNTGISTQLRQGATYSFSITHTRDAQFFSDARNNIRVWIDYNANGVYEVNSETAVSLNFETYGTSSATFTVPLNAPLGLTGMRITAKMSSDAGHAIPTPCDDPPDPIGYHGEIEEYKAEIVPSTNSVQQDITLNNVYVNATLELYDLTGTAIRTINGFTGSLMNLESMGLSRGLYLARITQHSDATSSKGVSSSTCLYVD